MRKIIFIVIFFSIFLLNISSDEKKVDNFVGKLTFSMSGIKYDLNYNNGHKIDGSITFKLMKRTFNLNINNKKLIGDVKYQMGGKYLFDIIYSEMKITGFILVDNSIEEWNLKIGDKNLDGNIYEKSNSNEYNLDFETLNFLQINCQMKK
jgi:hypothetical protein